MRCKTRPFAPDSRSASGYVAATNGKVSRTLRRGQKRRSSTTGSFGCKGAPRTGLALGIAALAAADGKHTRRPAEHELLRRCRWRKIARDYQVRYEHERRPARGRVPEFPSPRVTVRPPGAPPACRPRRSPRRSAAGSDGFAQVRGMFLEQPGAVPDRPSRAGAHSRWVS